MTRSMNRMNLLLYFSSYGNISTLTILIPESSYDDTSVQRGLHLANQNINRKEKKTKQC